MDCHKVGKLICSLRKEKNMTQKELADAMNISDRTISKWERGLGCPDVSLLHELSTILKVHMEKMLAGDLDPNEDDRGDMRRVKFYVCPNCGNVLFSTSAAEISCCGRKLASLAVNAEDENKPYYFPSIEAGKFVEKENRITMPLSITAHHATTDGWHIKTFLEDLQNAMNSPAGWI